METARKVTFVIAWLTLVVGAVLVIVGFTDPSRVLLIFIGLVIAGAGVLPWTLIRRRA